MEEFSVTAQMNRKSHFSAQTDILYRALTHSLILLGVTMVIFWAVFLADYFSQGAEVSWGITRSLMYIAIFVTAMVVAYIVYTPVHASIKAAILARDPIRTAPYTVTFSKDRITMTDNGENRIYIGWLDLKIYRETKRFLILRDRTKKNQTGQIVLPKTAIADEQVRAVRTYREEVLRRDELRRSPVARGRAKQAQERAARARANQTTAKESEDGKEKDIDRIEHD